MFRKKIRQQETKMNQPFHCSINAFVTQQSLVAICDATVACRCSTQSLAAAARSCWAKQLKVIELPQQNIWRSAGNSRSRAGTASYSCMRLTRWSIIQGIDDQNNMSCLENVEGLAATQGALRRPVINVMQILSYSLEFWKNWFYLRVVSLINTQAPPTVQQSLAT